MIKVTKKKINQQDS